MAVLALAVIMVVGAVPEALRPFVPALVGQMGPTEARAVAASDPADAVSPLDVAGLAESFGSVVHRLDERAIEDLAAGRTDVAAPQALPDAMAPLGTRCVGVAIFGVRGSGESATEHNGLGETVNAAVAAMADPLAGLDVAVQAVDYPADPVAVLFSDPARYIGGIQVGAARLSDLLRERAAACPEEVRLVIGFSQGAMVAHTTLAQGGAAGAQVRAAVDGVLLVSDGLRSGAPDERSLGSARASAGIAPVLGLRSGTFPAGLGERLVSVCDAGDPVCDPISTGPGGVTIHTSYKIGHRALHEAALDTVEVGLSGR